MKPTGRNLPKNIISLISSKAFLLLLSGSWIAYYIFSAIWMNESFANYVIQLQTSRTQRILFIVFLVSGWLNTARACAAEFRKNRVSAVAWLILPVGLMIFASGWYSSLTERQFKWVIVGEGHRLGPAKSPELYTVEKIDSGLRDRMLDTDMEQGIGFFKYEPKVHLRDDKGGRFVAGAFPAARVGSSYMHILNFGLAPGVALSKGGQDVSEGYMPLKITGAGGSDYFEIEPYPYRFVLSMEPEKTIKKGSVSASSYNLKDPFYSARVYENEKMIAEGNSRVPLKFNDFEVRFIGGTTWIQMEVVTDPGYPILVAGVFIVLAGIPVSIIRMLVLLFWGANNDSRKASD